MNGDVSYINNVKFELKQDLWGRWRLCVVRPQVSVREENNCYASIARSVGYWTTRYEVKK